MRGYDLIIIKDITEGGIGEVEGGWGDGAVSAREMAFEEGLEVRAKVPSCFGGPKWLSAQGKWPMRTSREVRWTPLSLCPTLASIVRRGAGI